MLWKCYGRSFILILMNMFIFSVLAQQAQVPQQNSAPRNTTDIRRNQPGPNNRIVFPTNPNGTRAQLPPPADVQPPPRPDVPALPGEAINCANLIYAGSKSSVCFSDHFLEVVRRETNISPSRNFTPIKVAENKLFDYPFAIMTGEGDFTLRPEERKKLKDYLTRGGFLLASAGCSSPPWNRAFRMEIKKIFPEKELKILPMNHPIFSTVYEITQIKLKHGGAGKLEGLEHDGRIVMIYSAEGLNDTQNVHGCCCCGGNEINNCREINVNIFTYALTH